MKTSSIRKHEPAWHIINAQGKVVGRLATEASALLRGKGKVTFVQHMDCGDHVVIINAKDITLTGNKAEDKVYHHHTWHPGGIKTTYAKKLMEDKPEEIITRAVKGMLPKTKLQPEWMKRLHVYANSNHPHGANVAGLNIK